MQTLSLGSSSMMITTLLPSWCAITSRRSVVCCANLRAAISLWPTISRRRLSSALIKNFRSFRGEAKFSTWLYRIAYNCFREDARKRKELVGIDEDRARSRSTIRKPPIPP